jgi:hypothetical protein
VAGLGFLLWPGNAFEWPTAKPTPIPTPTAIPQVVPASITARAKAHGGFIFADSDQRLLGEEDLNGLSSTELRIARNEIYARHGRFFVDQTLANYFSQFSWYHPRQVDVELSPLETTNVNTIQTAERRK